MKKALSIIGAVIALLSLTADSSAQTKIINNGPDWEKKVLVVVGDGYAAEDQAKYNADVDKLIAKGVFSHDFFQENQNAFNVYRLNLISKESGMWRRKYDAKDVPIPSEEKPKDTALKYIWTGQREHVYAENSPETASLLDAALTGLKWDNVLVIVNEDEFGGWGNSPYQLVSRTVGWDTTAHEMGHGIGGLRDEYADLAGAYPDGPVNGPNCSTILSKSEVHWNRFVSPTTATPTVSTGGVDSFRTVGLWQGCDRYPEGTYRPARNCRMNISGPPFCPVCYTHMKKALFPFLKHYFYDAVAGDFSGDGRSDLLVHNDQDLALYRTNPKFAPSPATGRGPGPGPSSSPTPTPVPALEWVWAANNVVPSAGTGRISLPSWSPGRNDKYFVGDFDGDNKDDVFAFNDGSEWGGTRFLGLLRATGTGLECVARYDNSVADFWKLSADDKFFVGDFNGDKNSDLLVFNRGVAGGTVPGSKPRLAVLKSNGASLSGLARYDGTLPGWSMQSGDRHFVGDFDGDGKDDLYVFNGVNYGSREFLGMYQSTGDGLSKTKIFADSLPGWEMNSGDQFYLGDFDKDGKTDLYVFNGTNWGSLAYLLMAKSTGTDLSFIKRYDSSSAGAIPGWPLRKGDRLFISDANRDGRADLFVFNPAIDWPAERLGALLSDGTALSGSYSTDWVGGWNLGRVDQILVGHYEDGVGQSDLFIRNNEWFGMLHYAAPGFALDRIHYRWIYPTFYDSRPWSDSLP